MINDERTQKLRAVLREERDRIFAALVAEECAKVCDDLWQSDGSAMACRDAICAKFKTPN